MIFCFWRNLAITALAVPFLACTADASSFYLEVRLRTDYQPIREFLSAEVMVESESQTDRARIDGSYVAPPAEIARFERLPGVEMRKVTVRLLRANDSALAETFVVFEQKDDLVLTVAMTRDCAALDCAIGERCIAGKCVDPLCVDGGQQSCIDGRVVECDPANNGMDCPVESHCAVRVCAEGICYQDASGMAACMPGEICALDVDACVPDSSETCTLAEDCKRADGLACINVRCVADLCVYGIEPDGRACGGGAMCFRGRCQGECIDGMLNRDESDVDCGGTFCPACTLGQTCNGNGDCGGGLVCDLQESQACEMANICGNGTKDSGGNLRRWQSSSR